MTQPQLGLAGLEGEKPECGTKERPTGRQFHHPARAMHRRSLSAFANSCFTTGHASGAQLSVSIVRMRNSPRAYGSRKGMRTERLLNDLIRAQQQRRAAATVHYQPSVLISRQYSCQLCFQFADYQPGFQRARCCAKTSVNRTYVITEILNRGSAIVGLRVPAVGTERLRGLGISSCAAGA